MMAVSDGNFFFGNFAEWLLLKDRCKDIFRYIYLRNSRLHHSHEKQIVWKHGPS